MSEQFDNIDMLTEVDREVLVALLIGGDNSPSNIAEYIDRHPNSVGDALDRLESEDMVFNKGSGVYALRFQGVTTARTLYREFEIGVDLDFGDEELY